MDNPAYFTFCEVELPLNGLTFSLLSAGLGGFKLSKVPKGPGAKLKLDSGWGLHHTRKVVWVSSSKIDGLLMFVMLVPFLFKQAGGRSYMSNRQFFLRKIGNFCTGKKISLQWLQNVGLTHFFLFVPRKVSKVCLNGQSYNDRGYAIF